MHSKGSMVRDEIAETVKRLKMSSTMIDVKI